MAIGLVSRVVSVCCSSGAGCAFGVFMTRAAADGIFSCQDDKASFRLREHLDHVNQRHSSGRPRKHGVLLTTRNDHPANGGWKGAVQKT